MPRPSRAPRTPPRAAAAVTAAATALGVAVAAAPARADDGFALGRFDPSFAGDALFGVPSPGAAGDGAHHLALVADYAHAPLVLRGETTGKRYGAVVANQVAVHVDATYNLVRGLALNLDLPVSFQHGDTAAAGVLSAPAPNTVGLGDLRLGVRAAVFGDATAPFQIGLGALLWVPTGSRRAYAGDGALRTQPQLVVGGVTKLLVWSAAVGPELRASRPVGDLAAGASLRWGAGVGFTPGRIGLQIGPEVRGSVGFTGPLKRTSDVEIFAGARHRFARQFVVGLGAGTGLTASMGTPDFRGLFSFAWSPEVAPESSLALDRDHDGVADDGDACPDQAGSASADPGKNGCPAAAPAADRDGDGILDADDGCPDLAGVPDVVPRINGCPPDRDNDEIADAEDACPTELGVRSPDPKRNGCAATDRDRDGVPDYLDACPELAGQPSTEPKRNGCPGDRDGDRILDEADACPEEKGPADPDPQKNGCPRDVRVTEGQIVILQQVEFDIGKASIRAVSNALLDTVAGVLREHVEIAKLEVQGHTDNRGPAEQNTALSEARAQAVVAALAKRGIDRGRLTAKGYGPTKPIMANVTTMGRQKNRRVEFHILERR